MLVLISNGSGTGHVYLLGTLIFMPPDRMIGGILILSRLFVCLFFCLYVVDFILRYNF